MKQYIFIVLVLLLNLTVGYCSECEEDSSIMIDTTVRADKLEETTAVTTVSDEDTTVSSTVDDEETTEVTTDVPSTLPATTTTQPVTAPNDPCATTKKSFEELSPSIRYFMKSSDCLTLKSGTVLVDANHCRRYYVCSSGKTIRNICPVGNWYDRKTSSCRLRADVSNCPANRN